MKKTYEYHAYPTTKQRKFFTVWLALLRSLYNQALAWRIEAYEIAGLTVKWTTQATALPDFKRESKAFAGLHAVALRGGAVVTNTPETPAQTGTEARNPISPGERVTSPIPSGWGN